MRRCTALFPGGNHEHPSHVVTAIAVLGPGLGKEGVLEGAALVGHVDEVAEVRLGSLRWRVHTNASRSARRRSASRRYWPATTDHPRLGARRDASAAILAASSGLVRTLRSASAIASGSSWSTTIPAPLESNSTACGKAVATTGRPGRDGVDEHARRHLVLGVIGQDDHLAGLDQSRQRRHVAIVGVEVDGRGNPVSLGLLNPRLTVRLSVCRQNLGMRPAGHQVARPRREIVQRPHGLNGAFDSLARTDQTPGQDDGPAYPVRHDTGLWGWQRRGRWFSPWKRRRRSRHTGGPGPPPS